MGLWRSW
jgi:excisionase family DNA binding protein